MSIDAAVDHASKYSHLLEEIVLSLVVIKIQYFLDVKYANRELILMWLAKYLGLLKEFCG